MDVEQNIALPWKNNLSPKKKEVENPDNNRTPLFGLVLIERTYAITDLIDNTQQRSNTTIALV
jgi:hypothetical protein